MKQTENLSLERFNSFGVKSSARRAVQIDSTSDLEGLPFDPVTDLVLGGGSNLLFAGDVPGTVLINRLQGMRLIENGTDDALVEAAAGELWHSLVLWSLSQGLNGLENLSLIPGLAGAAPIQNIGAYGVELANCLESLQAWSWREQRLVEFSRDECGFGYRTSRFKAPDRDAYLVTAIRLRLSRRFEPCLAYSGLSEALAEMNAKQPDARLVSQAVIRLRRQKLPDPALLGNAGSFFKNPVVTSAEAEALRSRHDGIPVHGAGAGKAKLSAGWMIEQCGWKGHREGDAGVSEQHALVLVNHGSASGAAILSLARRVAESVFESFGVALEPEPVIVGASFNSRLGTPL